MSSLLLSERPLIILPKLAVIIGLNEAIVLQQIHYWLLEKQSDPKKYANTFVNDQWWVYNTLDQWQSQFPFWSVMTIRRALESLEAQGLVISDTLSEDKRNRTKWYRIDYDVLEAREGVAEIPEGKNTSNRAERTPASVQSEQITSVQPEHKQPRRMNACLISETPPPKNTQRIHQRVAPAGAQEVIASPFQEIGAEKRKPKYTEEESAWRDVWRKMTWEHRDQLMNLFGTGKPDLSGLDLEMAARADWIQRKIESGEKPRKGMGWQ